MMHVLVIGVGSIGERHLRCFLQTGRVRASFCETNETLRQTIRERYGVEGAHARVEDALAGGSFDAAVICTPAPLHIPIALQLADAGIHLLIEKPLSTSLEQIDQLRQAVERKRLQAAVAYVWRANPAAAAMRRMIAQGQFGPPVQIVIQAGQHFPTYRPAYRQIYYADRRTGGGAIQDALTHMLNLGEWLVGPIDSLAGDCAHQVLDGVSVEDTAHIVTRQGGVLGCYSLNQYQSPNESFITVNCRQGTVRLEGHRAALRWALQPESPWAEEQFGPLQRDDIFVRQANAFLDQIEKGQPPLCSLDEGLQTLKVNLAALQAADQHRWVQVSPAS